MKKVNSLYPILVVITFGITKIIINKVGIENISAQAYTVTVVLAIFFLSAICGMIAGILYKKDQYRG